MSSSRTWLITGASRGIGFSIVQLLLRSPENIVFASCRNPASALALTALADGLETRGKLHVIQMDITDEASVSRAADEVANLLGDAGLDYLINNAGIAMKNDTPSSLELKDLSATIVANVAGPMLVTRTFTSLIEKGHCKVIANISSALASLGGDYYGGELSSYSISKAALNMLTYKQAKERPDLIPFLVDPGWVKTDMGGSNATLEPHESAAGIIEVVSNADASYAGRFINYKGEAVPW